jgi:hypothetical protein
MGTPSADDEPSPFDRLDGNRDGLLTSDEFEGAKGALFERRRASPIGQPGTGSRKFGKPRFERLQLFAHPGIEPFQGIPANKDLAEFVVRAKRDKEFFRQPGVHGSNRSP